MPKKVTASFFFEGELQCAEVFSRDADCSLLFQKWQNYSGPKEQDFLMTIGHEDGSQVPTEGKIGDLIPPRENNLELFIKTVCQVRFGIIGAPNFRDKTSVHSCKSADDVAIDIKKAIGVCESRPARLFCNSKQLCEEDALLNQVDSDSLIMLDLEMNLSVLKIPPMKFYPVLKDPDGNFLLTEDLKPESREHVVSPEESQSIPAFQRTPFMHKVTLYASDYCKQLVEPSDERQRLVADETGQETDPEQSIMNLVSIEELVGDSCQVVRSEEEMTIKVHDLMKKQRSEVRVWPTSKLAYLVRKRGQCIYIDGEEAKTDQTFWQAGLADGSALSVTKRITISVVNSDGIVHSMKIDAHQTLHDLHQVVSVLEDNEHFRIHLDGQKLLYDERTLYQHGIRNKSILELKFATRSVYLSIKGEAPVLMSKVKKGTRFEAFRSMASKCFGRVLPNDSEFTCECGRILSSEGHARQEFPLKCCPRVKPVFVVKIPENQRVKTHTLDSNFRAPCSKQLTKLVKNIETLSNPETEYYRQEAEAALLQGCLQLENAKDIKVTKDEVLFMRVKNLETKEIFFWMRSNQTVFDVIKAMERRINKRVLDLAVLRENHYVRLNARDHVDMTVKDAGLKSKDDIQVIYTTFSDNDAQTECPQTDVSLQCSPRYSEALTVHPGSGRGRLNMQLSPPLGVAKFWISWWGRRGDPNFSLDLPFWHPGMRTEDLRAAIATEKKVRPSEVEMQQRRGVRKKGGAAVVDTGGGEGWGTAAGEEVQDRDVKSDQFHLLKDGEVLLTPGGLRALIRAYKK